MVCKKFQVYNWFRTLDGAKRIDFLNGMLHICFPLELRFLGSCIEELARKDYTYLRDAEIKANAAYEIQQMRDISDKITRSKMIVTLALLASSNYECARLIYDLLNVDILDLLDKMKSNLDEKIADEFLLLLTMAANHPAFDFQMKTKMSQLSINAEKKLKQFKVILKESESDLCLCALGTDEYTSQAKEKNVSNGEIIPTTSTNTITNNVVEVSDFMKTEINNNTLKAEDFDSNSKLNIDTIEKENTKQPLIESIDFEGVQMIQGTDNYKFLIKIRWSDKEYNVIDKTYSELCEFNRQLINLFPKELNGLIESSQLVFKENQKEDVIKELPLVTDYCSKIASFPKLVSESEFLRSFFRSNLSNSSIAIANESNSPNKTVIPNKTTPVSNSNESSITTTSSKEEISESTTKANSQEMQSNKSQRSNLGTIIEMQSIDDTNEINRTLNNSTKQETNNSTNFTDTNEMFNDSISEKTSKRTNSTNNNEMSSSSSTLPMHINTQMYPPNLSRPNSANSGVNVLSNQITGLVPQQPILNQFNTFNPMQPPFLNMNQQLHLQAFQPIQNIMISSPPCPSPSPMSSSVPNSNQLAAAAAAAAAASSLGINTHSLNNSRSNSPWNMMPPPPALPSLIPQPHPNFINNPQFYAPHYQINTYPPITNTNPNREFISGVNFKPNSHNNLNKSNLKEYLNRSQSVNNHDETQSFSARCSTETNLNSKSQMTTQNDERSDSFDEINNKQNEPNVSNNRKTSDSFKKNLTKTKTMQSSSESLMWQNAHETNTNNQENDTISPKISKENTNKPSNSLNQTLPQSLQQQQSHYKQQQPKLISPYQSNNPAMLASAFNPSAPPPLPPNYSTNTLLIQGNSQMINLPPYAQAQMSNSLLLAPIMPSSIGYTTSASSLPPTHPSLSQQQQQSNIKYLSRQNSNRMQMERPKSPAISNLTSDDENNDKKHNRRSSLRSSSTNSNTNKYSITRQHNSHSISSTATTIKPSSVSNASSNSSLNSNTNPRITCSNSSLSASPSSQQPNSQSVSPINSKNNNISNNNNNNNTNNKNKFSLNGNNEQSALSPQSLINSNNKQQSQKNVVSSPEIKDDKNSDTNESINTKKKTDENKDRFNVSSTSLSSSLSTATLTNQPTKSPNVSNLIPIPHQQHQPHHMHTQYQSLHQTHSQPSSLSSSSSMTNNNLYYSPVVSPFTYIDSTNLYALTNSGLPTSANSSSAHHPLGPTIIHPFNPYQPPPPPPPQSSSQNSSNSYQHQLIQPQHQHYFNLIPVIQPPPNIVSQPPPPSSSCPPQVPHSNMNNNSSNGNTNCTTPTPGSSPNPPLSSSSSSSSNSSTNLNLNQPNPSNSVQYPTLTHPPPPPPQGPPPTFPFDQQILNPYGFNMMALANAVANSATTQPINPNIVMMMMMQNQHPSMPPLMQNQVPTSQVISNSNGKYNSYQHYQPYRSQTPNSLQQPSPSNLVNNPSSNNNSGSSSSSSFRSNYNQQTNKKKISCYNCGMMNHTAKDCDQPSLETMSQPTQYKLNFKMNNQLNMPTSTTNAMNTNNTITTSATSTITSSNNINNDHLEENNESSLKTSVSTANKSNSAICNTANTEL